MKKKTFISFVIVLFAAIFSVSYTFATDNTSITNDIRNTVGGAENVVEGAASGIAGGIKSGFEGVKNGAENLMDNTGNTMRSATTNDGDRNYAATRTSTEAGTTIGMNPTTWIWIVVALVLIGLVSLIWSYVRSNDNNGKHHHED